jgi:hypothetical protein
MKIPSYRARHRVVSALLVLAAQGCAASGARTQPTHTAPASAPPASAPPDTTAAAAVSSPTARPIHGPGWSAAIPADWIDEAPSARGAPNWRSPDGDARGLGFSVNTEPSAESLEEMARNTPAAYQRNGGTAHVQIAPHRGRPALHVEVAMPAESGTELLYAVIMMDGRRGVVVNCEGAESAERERTCLATLTSPWFGPNDAAMPPTAAAAGMRWFGARGRFVQVPTSWQPLPAPTGAPDALVTGDGDARYVVTMEFLDDIQTAPPTALRQMVTQLTSSGGYTVVREHDVHAGRRVGTLLDLTRRVERAGPTTILQRDIPAATPSTIFVLTCTGLTAEITEHPERCRAIFDSFVVEAPH